MGMSRKTRIKSYKIGGFYHIYNRGNNKEPTFIENSDYEYFLGKIEYFLKERNHNKNVEINSYCLMPNHFHLSVQNKLSRGIERFMRSLITSYSKGFNKKYGHVGHVWQERYQAVDIMNEDQLLTAIKYIHNNPKDSPFSVQEYPYSSHRYYLNGRGPSWLKKEPILSLFGDRRRKDRYRKYVEN